MGLGEIGWCVLAAAVIPLASCTSEVRACGPVADEALDELSSQHVIAGASVRFDDAAPTSGPHLSLVGPGGIYTESISPLDQVTLLESGKVLIQYDPAQIDAAEVEPFADDETAVAPNSELDVPLSLTAWQVRQECDDVDVAAIRSFTGRYVGAPRSH